MANGQQQHHVPRLVHAVPPNSSRTLVSDSPLAGRAYGTLTQIVAHGRDRHWLPENEDMMLRLRVRIMLLITILWPKLRMPIPPAIETLGSGSFNLVMGITIESANDALKPFKQRVLSMLGCAAKPLNWALRVNLHGPGLFSDLPRDVANQLVIHARLPKLVPKLISYDLTANNSLGKPYMLQERVSGTNFNEAWNLLSGDQCCSVMRQLVKITERIASITAPAPGLISLENISSPSKEHIDLVQWPVPFFDGNVRQEDGSKPGEIPAPPLSPLEYILDRCSRWITHELSQAITQNLDRWARFAAIARSLDRLDFLGDHFHLCHMDLYPRNVIVLPQPNDGIQITGIVDWDMAHFSPKFMALRPPLWAWRKADAGDKDEDEALTESNHPLESDLKKAYLQTASKDSLRFGMSKESIIARKMWMLLVAGMEEEHNMERGDIVIDNWNDLYPGDFVYSVNYDPQGL